METFLFIVVFILGWACGEYYGLGRPRKFLPPEGTILRIETVAPGRIFHAVYKGNMISFQAKDDQLEDIRPGYFKISTDTWVDSEKIPHEAKILKPVKM
jgi:hypothetical protein